MTDEKRIRDVLSKKVASFNPPATSSVRRRNKERVRLKEIRSGFTEIAAQELGYSTAVPAWIVWMLLSTAIKAIIKEMAKQLYDKLTKEGESPLEK